MKKEELAAHSPHSTSIRLNMSCKYKRKEDMEGMLDVPVVIGRRLDWMEVWGGCGLWCVVEVHVPRPSWLDGLGTRYGVHAHPLAPPIPF